MRAERMNRRQRKKQFKKRYGFNPPRNIPIQTAIKIMERRERIIATTERLKATILNLWEVMREPLLQFVEALKEFGTAFITVPQWERGQRAALQRLQTQLMLQQRQQEREVKQVESNINILNHDRR